MAADVDLVNAALRSIGSERIVSLDDGTKNANVAKDVYSIILEDMIRAHEWNFASRRLKLARMAANPIYEYEYAYAFPSDWLRTVAVTADSAGRTTPTFREEFIDTQHAILSDEPEIWMLYVAQVTDVNRMPADFRHAMQLSLAREFSIPIAASNRMHDSFERRAARVLARARSMDAKNATPDRRPIGSWTQVRYRSTPIVGNST